MASDPATLRKQAQEHFASQRWVAALAVYDELLDLDRDDAGALAGRGAVRIQLGELKGAVDDLGRSLAIEPDPIHVRFNRGLALSKLGRFADALADFEAYLAADPKDADALRHRARCRAELGEVEEQDGRLVAAPSALANVPARLRIEQAFGWGWPTFGVSLVGGTLYLLAHAASLPKPMDGGVLAVIGVGLVIGVLSVVMHVRAVRRRLVLVPTVGGMAVYRDGERIAEWQRNQLHPYAHSIFNTVYFLAMLGLALFLAASFGGKEPGILLSLLPVIAILASNLRSRMSFAHLYLLPRESVAMFPKDRFAHAFGDVQRWA